MTDKHAPVPPVHVLAAEHRFRRLTHPGPLSGPNPFARFWRLRQRIRPLFANMWGSA